MSGSGPFHWSSQIEAIHPDGTQASMVAPEGSSYPAPSPDGQHFAYVYATRTGISLVERTLADSGERVLIPESRFGLMAYPRYSPDGGTIALVGLSSSGTPPSPVNPSPPLDGLGRFLTVATTEAHGLPWEVWLVDADGSNLRQVPDVMNDDASLARSPDGTRLLVYGGWGTGLVDLAQGTSDLLPFLPGYGAVAWLPDLGGAPGGTTPGATSTPTPGP